MKVHFMAHVNEDDQFEICVMNSKTHQDIQAATLQALVSEWISDNTLDGDLHPYVDETLAVLWSLNQAQRDIVDHLEQDDPHRRDFHTRLDSFAMKLRDLIIAIEGIEEEKPNAS